MKIIERKRYLERLVKLRDNGQVKIITGIRRCGKSFLLNNIFRDHLLQSGVDKGRIVMLDLDDDTNARYRNPILLGEHLRELIGKGDATERRYVLIDEIQKVKPVANPYLPGEKIGFVDVLNGLRKLPADVYVTGSNSQMLSSDIATEFRGRGDVVHLAPLTFDEFYATYDGDKRLAWREFITYGGMPRLISIDTHEDKAQYLADLFRLIYLKDVIERNRLKTDEALLDELLNVVASAVGSLTNPTKIANTFHSAGRKTVKSDTIARHLGCFVDAFILNKALRYDIKGRSYIDTPLKYYFSDIGLRNARLNFRQQEENHIMENILYNELRARGFSVDVGMIPVRRKDAEGRSRLSMLEVDFVVNKGERRYYIQSALTVAEEDKRLQETNSLKRIDDSFSKIVVTGDNRLPWTDEDGVRYTNIEDFLLSEIDSL